MSFDFVALAPEIILTVFLCAALVVDLFLPKERKGLVMPVAFIGVLLTLAAVLNLVGDNRETLAGMFVVDQFAVLFKAVFCVAALIVFAISHDYLKEDNIHQGEYYTLLLSSLLGMLTIASSRDLIPIFVSLELISVPAFVLAGLRKSDLRSNEAALKFFLFGVLSTAIMLYGMSLIYGVTGTTNLQAISAVLTAEPVLRSISVLSIFFIIVGFGFKISAFPFQWWVPDTYEGSPVPVAAFLSVASKTAGFVGLLQIMFIAFQPLADVWRPFLAIVAVLTMTFGNLVALQQRNIIRLLAYSSIAQAGYILLPLGVASATDVGLNKQAFSASILYLLIYTFMETGAFAAAIAFGRRGGGYLVENYSGAFAKAPGLAIAMTVFLFSLAGVPPFAGWAAKLFVFLSVIAGKSLVLAVFMALNAVIALYYYAAIVKRMFGDAPKESARMPVPALLGSAIAFAATVVVVVGVMPDLFAHVASISTLF
ncbi:MAG: NADH-quinone oxidoreductase subunit N [Actinomycetota bacterium]